MKITHISGLLLVASLILLMTACAPATPSPTPTPEPTATQQPTQTPEPTATEAPTPEASPTTAETATQPAAAPAGAAADQYQYVSQTLPDGYQVRPNTVVTISWTVKNTGPTAWGTDYSLRYFAGPEVKNTYVAFPKIISANESAQLTVTFTTPAAAGDYDLWYKLVNNLGQNFGDVNFQFTVTNTPGAPKPSATP